MDKRLYLLGSNYGNRHDENSVAMYEFIQSHNGSALYISNEVTNADTIRRGSLKSYKLFLNSEAVFFTHSLSDILPYLHKANWLLKLCNLPRRVFIQHGVIGLKSMVNTKISMSDYLKSIAPGFDVMVVSSSAECKIVEQLGIPSPKLAITGLPRFDFLSGKIAGNTVLVFLTWTSMHNYQLKLSSILSSKALRLLRASGLEIVVEAHPMLAKEESIKMLVSDQKDSLQSVIMNASLLITDDSSVAWDFFYKGSEVIFYKPDSDWLISDNKLLINRIANTELEFDQLAQKFLDNSLGAVPKACDYKDQQNAERVFMLASNSLS